MKKKRKNDKRGQTVVRKAKCQEKLLFFFLTSFFLSFLFLLRSAEEVSRTPPRTRGGKGAERRVEDISRHSHMYGGQVRAQKRRLSGSYATRHAIRGRRRTTEEARGPLFVPWEKPVPGKARSFSGMRKRHQRTGVDTGMETSRQIAT